MKFNVPTITMDFVGGPWHQPTLTDVILLDVRLVLNRRDELSCHCLKPTKWMKRNKKASTYQYTVAQWLTMLADASKQDGLAFNTSQAHCSMFNSEIESHCTTVCVTTSAQMFNMRKAALWTSGLCVWDADLLHLLKSDIWLKFEVPSLELDQFTSTQLHSTQRRPPTESQIIKRWWRASSVCNIWQYLSIYLWKIQCSKF